jgi:hypothetical protein
MSDQGKGCGALLLSIAAIGISVYLLVDRHEERARAQRQEFRNIMVHLQESAAEAQAVDAPETSAAKPWIYYDAARKLEPEMDGQIGMVDYLVLANFAFAHSNMDAAEGYVRKARRVIDQGAPTAQTALAYNALGHIYFRHAPKTDIAQARKFYQMALDKLKDVKGDSNYFVQAAILQEWAMDEYMSGNEKEGDELLAKCKAACEDKNLPTHYMDEWRQQIEAGAIQSKVRGGIL